MSDIEDHRMRQFRACRPDSENLAGWEDSERAKAILTSIVEAQPALGRRAKLGTWPRRRIVWSGAAATLLIAVACTALWLAWRPRENADVPAPGPGVSNVVLADSMTRGQALDLLLPAVEASRGGAVVKRPTESVAPHQDLIQSGRTLGVLDATDDSGPALSEPVTFGRFAVWVWRAFGSALLPGSVGGPPMDLPELAPEEKLAIEGLAGAGVLSSSDAEKFAGDGLLTKSEALTIVDRIETLLATP